MKDSAAKILKETLRNFNISNNQVHTERRLKSHPDHPSLKSLCDTIEEFGVKTYPTKVSKGQLKEIEGNFVAHIYEEGDKVYVFVSKYSSDGVEYYSSNKKIVSVSLDEFHQIYTGIVIQLEKTEVAEEYGSLVIPKQRISNILSLTLLGLGLLYVVWQFTVNLELLISSNYHMVLMIAKLMGLVISGHMVYRDWTYDTSFTEKICKSGKNMDCDSVLNSKFSTVYGWVKWSDLGFIYFVSTFFILVSGNEFSSVIQSLSLLAGLYIFVSLYQQAFLIRKWCILCLGVLLILSIEMGFALATVSNVPAINETISGLFYLIVPGIVILFLKQALRDDGEINELSIKYDKQKRDPEVFKALWLNGQQIVTPESPYNIILGNRTKFAPRITVFLSLTCRYCGETFKSLQSVLEEHDDLSVHVIPVVENSWDKIQSAFMESLYTRYKDGGSSEALETLEEWYNGGYHKKTSKTQSSVKEEAHAFIEANNQNAIRNQIRRYPALFFQSRSKPNGYTLEEALQFKSLVNQPILTAMPTKNEMII